MVFWVYREGIRWRRRVCRREKDFRPVVAHRLEDGIVEFDGPRDEEGRVRWLRRHCGKWSCLWMV